MMEMKSDQRSASREEELTAPFEEAQEDEIL
jgi:hypothetical protein